ncbi:WD repeat-containing protein 97-like isoform 1-T4 [Menidia menidia]
MVAAGEKSTPTATLKVLSQHSAAPQEKTAQNQELLQRYDSQPPEKVVVSEGRQQLLTHHGLRHQQHVPCDSPVRFLMFWEAAGSFISLHSDQTVRLHKANGHRQTLSACLPFAGLTATEIPGCLVGWGPGPVFTLLDSQLRPLDTADSALDIQLCEAAEHSKELVSAGAGNVCVWSVMLMRRRVTVREGLRQYGAFSHMALAAPRPAKPQRGFFASGQNVVVVDLDGGRVLERKERLCPRNITAMVYCSQLDCLIISSEDLAITVWDSDWKLHVVFLGHTAVVTSLFYCSELNILVSSSADCTIRIWNVEGCDTIDCIKTEQKRPPLYIRATKKGDTFLTVSHKGIDFWAFRNLYTLHCQLGREEATLRQIVVPQLPASYPTRVLCISGDRNISLLAEETGAVLTFYQAKQKILCADYLLQKEILLALTEAGTVLQANTLSNPITLMQEWTGVGQGPWQPTDHVTKKDAKKLPVPGPASCLVLYSSVADTQRALEEWRSLQGERGSSHRKYIELNNTKNKFLIIIGQIRGCVSVLKSDNGTVLFRIPAHSGQRVTTMQAYPEEHCLLSSGEDLTVVLWRVYPHIKECLTQQLSVPCDQPQICFAALGSQMALSFQEPSSGSYRLRFFSLHNQTVYQPKEGHSDNLTGLCVIPEMKLLVSISLDRTMQVWNEENQLIRTLQLQAVPQCLAYSCSGGQLYLGIGGDLFKMRCAKFLPTNYREMLSCSRFSEPHSDEPIAVIKETFNQTNMSKLEEDILQAITNNRLLIGGMQQQEILLSSNMDMEALLQSSVKCQKGKPPSNKQTQKEAFGNYMTILYGLKPLDKVHIQFLTCGSAACSIKYRIWHINILIPLHTSASGSSRALCTCFHTLSTTAGELLYIYIKSRQGKCFFKIENHLKVQLCRISGKQDAVFTPLQITVSTELICFDLLKTLGKLGL